MILNDPKLRFQGHAILWRWMSKNVFIRCENVVQRLILTFLFFYETFRPSCMSLFTCFMPLFSGVCQLFLYEYMDINMDQTCEHNILQTNEPILMSRFTEQPETIWGSWGQRSRSNEAKDKFGDLGMASSQTKSVWCTSLEADNWRS